MAWYDVEIPAGMIPLTGDLVRYTAKPKSGAKDINTVSIYAGSAAGSSACFGAHMTRLDEFEFTCCPVGEKSMLPADLYGRWMTLGQIVNIIPSDCSAWSERGKNFFHAPAGNNRHQTYAALCMYRWAENQAPMVYTVMRVLERNPQVSFFQALHYGGILFALNSGHGFANFSIYCPTGAKVAYIPAGVAVALFFRRTKDRPNGYAGEFAKQPGTANHIDSITKKMGCEAPVDFYRTYGPRYDAKTRSYKYEPYTSPLPELVFTKPEHILWDEVTKLYSLDDPAHADIKNVWDEATKSHRKQCVGDVWPPPLRVPQVKAKKDTEKQPRAADGRFAAKEAKPKPPEQQSRFQRFVAAIKNAWS